MRIEKVIFAFCWQIILLGYIRKPNDEKKLFLIHRLLNHFQGFNLML
jgi:hypothetical protein